MTGTIVPTAVAARHQPLLSMRGVSKAYAGVRALKAARLEVAVGQVVALVGENGAGKSTLMKVLLGLTPPDEGEISFEGRIGRLRSPTAALAAGISMIHQEISLVPSMSIAENLWLGRESRFTQFGIIRDRERHRAAQQQLDELGFRLDAGARVDTLSVAQKQLVEIARAVSYRSRLVIMDEPTSALTPGETSLLFQTIRQLTRVGTGIVFISHKLDEVFEIADRIFVMRDGETVADHSPSEVSTEQLIGLIAGRDVHVAAKPERLRHDEVVLDVAGLSGDGFTDVSLRVHRGEVVGLAGLMGSGRTEIVRAIYGLDAHQSGTVDFCGERLTLKTPSGAVRRHIGMVTEDRLHSGSIYELSVTKNSTLPYLPLFRRGLLLPRLEKRAYENVARRLRIKSAGPNSPIGQLSGGNQQKVLISRWLHVTPKLLIFDEPTRGIDVGAKAEIYDLIGALAANGTAVLVVSSELPELRILCDRILVVRKGRIVHESVDRREADDEILSHAFGVTGARYDG